MIQRKFITGEEWLYFKLYCGPRIADILLINTITPLVNELKEKNLICQWFFIRYSDPEPHIRFRLKLLKPYDLVTVIALFNNYIKPYSNSNQIWRIQTDTYVRELERYGSSSISYVEEIFHSESELIVELLKLNNNRTDLNQYVLESVDSFLKSFDLSTHERVHFYKSNYIANKKKLELKYGKLRVKPNDIQMKFMNPSNGKSFGINLIEYDRFKRNLQMHNERISKAVMAIVTQSKKINTDINLLVLLQSMVHMSFNRAFNIQQNLHEFLGYYLLSRRSIAELKKTNE